MEIVKASRKHPEKLINSCSEIYGGCRHKPKFHRYKEEVETPSTDELNKSERLNVAGGSPLILSHMARPARAFAEEKSFGASTSTQVII